MTSPAAEIAGYLHTKIGSLTSASNLFVSYEPAAPVDCVTVYDSGGYAPEQTFDGSNFIRRPTVQVRIRNDSYATGYALAETVRDTLQAVVNQTVGTTRILGVFTVSEPAHLGKIDTNAGLANVWTLNLQLITED